MVQEGADGELALLSTSPATGKPYWARTRSWCAWDTSATASEKTRRCTFPSPLPLIYDPSLVKVSNQLARTKILLTFFCFKTSPFVVPAAVEQRPGSVSSSQSGCKSNARVPGSVMNCTSSFLCIFKCYFLLRRYFFTFFLFLLYLSPLCWIFRDFWVEKVDLKKSSSTILWFN